jgi:hypothetical protein
LEEFLLLNRHIEKEHYDYKNVCKLFLENTDVYFILHRLIRLYKMASNACHLTNFQLFVWRTTYLQNKHKIVSWVLNTKKRWRLNMKYFKRNGPKPIQCTKRDFRSQWESMRTIGIYGSRFLKYYQNA